MSTHAIGSGTCNLSLNVPLDERVELGRAAFRAGARSVGDFLRQLVQAGLETVDPQTAKAVKQIRCQYYRAGGWPVAKEL